MMNEGQAFTHENLASAAHAFMPIVSEMRTLGSERVIQESRVPNRKPYHCGTARAPVG